ncbi:MAG TPA: hypothetical protein VH092_33765 [Urbifossiella sp.]|jgi:hypothetical protein|nr:hypothetical protein [Urbifossiella sp.]
MSRTTFKEKEAECWPVVLLGVLSSEYGHGDGGRADRLSGVGTRSLPPASMHLGVIVKARELLVLAEEVAARTAGEPPESVGVAAREERRGSSSAQG